MHQRLSSQRKRLEAYSATRIPTLHDPPGHALGPSRGWPEGERQGRPGKSAESRKNTLFTMLLRFAANTEYDGSNN